MFRLTCIAAFSALLIAPDVTPVSQLRQATTDPKQQIPANESIPVLPSFGLPAGQATEPAAGQTSAPAAGQTSGPAAGSDQPAAPAAAAGPLTEESRIQIIRYVSGESASMVTSLPSDKNGFHVKAGEAPDRDALLNAIRISGAAVNPGDKVQITRIAFEARDIKVDINGGPRGHTPLRDHIRLGVGGDYPVSTLPDPSETPAVPPAAAGATLYLDFGRAVPNLSPAELKKYLAVVFDFSGERSAAVQWVDSLPPNIRDAVEQKRAEVGMDRDEVLAALGRPDRKVREQEPDGTDTEDWIYGLPPKTTFVRFAGDKVIRVSQY
jgi:hypothetical protein